MFKASENNLYILDVFIDLSKAFDPVYHTILLKNIELYSTKGSNHNFIKNYLSNRKHYAEIDPTTKTSLELVKCGVPQGSVLAPILFLSYVNDLEKML